MTDACLTPTAKWEATMEDPKRDEPEAAEDVEDLDLEPDAVENVKGGTLGGTAPVGPGPRP
jgi:hypothetical protein